MGKNGQFSKKNRRFKAFSSLFLVLAIVMFNSILVSAFNFDNVKGGYDEETKEMTIKDSLLGVPTTTVATLKLNTPQHYIIFGTGYQKVAEIEIENFENDYDDAFTDIKFYNYDKEGSEITSAGFDYKYLTYKNITRDILQDCDPGVVCVREKIGTEQVQVQEWLPFDEKALLPKGKITIGIYYDDVQAGKTVEWIPEFFGVEIDEWASFSGAEAIEWFDDAPDTNYLSNTGRRGGQTFTIGTVGTDQDWTLAGFSLEIKRTGTPGLVNVSLYETNGTTPSTLITQNTTFNADNLDTSYAWFNITMPNVQLNKSAQYALVIEKTTTATVEYRSKSGDSYAGGTTVDDNAGPWVIPNADTVFYVYGWELINVTLTSPTNNSNQLAGNNISFFAIANSSAGLLNASLVINGVINLTNEISGGQNTTSFNQSFAVGQYNWSVRACDIALCANTINWTFTTTNIAENSITYNGSVYETASESFILNVTTDGTETITAEFFFNGTSQGASTKYGSDAEARFESNVNIPNVDSPQNQSFHWQFTRGSTLSNSSFTNVSVSPINLTLCGDSPMNTPYVNFTFKDEETDTDLTAFVDSSTWSYWLDDATGNKTLTYSNTAAVNSSYPFCFNPSYEGMTANVEFKYSNTSYPQRTLGWNNYEFTNNTLNHTLYLLATADGIYVTFQVLTGAGQTIEGASVTANRTISGTNTQVASGTTGGDGAVTFWLNPDYSHTFVFSASGYATSTQVITPTQSTYTVYLTETATSVNITDYNRDILYNINPISSELTNDTTYLFTLNLTSTYWSLDSFGFELSNGSSTLGVNSSTDSNGNLSYSLDVGNNASIFMNYYWVINGTALNFTKQYNIWTTTGRGYGINTFFTHLSTYTDDEIFGLNTFSRTLLIFLVIFFIVGGISYMTGVYSPSAVIALTWFLVAFFDFALGMIPSPMPNALPHAPTILLFILMLGIFYWEFRR